MKVDAGPWILNIMVDGKVDNVLAAIRAMDEHGYVLLESERDGRIFRESPSLYLTCDPEGRLDGPGSPVDLSAYPSPGLGLFRAVDVIRWYISKDRRALEAAERFGIPADYPHAERE